MKKKPVVIIGAGLSGLSCALHLQKHDIPCVIYESEGQSGGRVQSDSTRPQVRDRGFQVLLTSYPELRHVLDVEKLQLRKFNSGALVASREQGEIHKFLLSNPLQHPEEIFSGLFSQTVPFSDKTLVVSLIAKAHLAKKPDHPGLTTLQFLRQYGFSEHIIELFWRPFLAGVFLDPQLSLPADYFLFLVKCFSSGSVAVPEKGMSEIPRQMTQNLHAGTVQLNTAVASWDAHGVKLATGEHVEAHAVVAAFPRKKQDQDFYAVTNYYFKTSTQPTTGKWLILCPPSQGFKINNAIAISSVSASYGCPAQHVISVSALGHGHSPTEIQQELLQILPECPDLELSDFYVVHKALPKEFQNVGFERHNGVYWCGDQCSSPSINGALRSGRLTAEHLISSLL